MLKINLIIVIHKQCTCKKNKPLKRAKQKPAASLNIEAHAKRDNKSTEKEKLDRD